MSNKLGSILGFLALLVAGIQAQNGAPCHASIFQFTPRHSLNISEYMGDWFMHEIASSDIGNFPEPDWKCAQRSLSLPDVDDLLKIETVDTFVNISDGATVTQTKPTSVNNTRSPFSSVWKMDGGDEVLNDVIILAADLEFNQWTVMYSCSIRGPDAYRYEVAMAMTRTRTIEPEVRQFLKALMVGVGFRIGDHFPIDQTDC